MSIRIITPKTASQIVDWYERALNTPEISRFMTLTPQSSTPDDFADDWMCLTLMDAAQTGVVRLRPARGYNNIHCDMSCWVLPGPTQKYVAGRLIHAAFTQAANRFGSKYVDWSVHHTNNDSLRFSSRHGNLVGVRQEGAWDMKLGCWVASHEYRKNIEAYRYGNLFKVGSSSQARALRCVHRPSE